MQVSNENNLFILVPVGIQAQLKIRPPEDTPFLQQVGLLSRVRETKLRHKAQSEGYETMTQHSSDIASEVPYEFTKYMAHSKNIFEAKKRVKVAEHFLACFSNRGFLDRQI